MYVASFGYLIALIRHFELSKGRLPVTVAIVLYVVYLTMPTIVSFTHTHARLSSLYYTLYFVSPHVVDCYCHISCCFVCGSVAVLSKTSTKTRLTHMLVVSSFVVSHISNGVHLSSG